MASKGPVKQVSLPAKAGKTPPAPIPGKFGAAPGK